MKKSNIDIAISGTIDLPLFEQARFQAALMPAMRHARFEEKKKSGTTAWFIGLGLLGLAGGIAYAIQARRKSAQIELPIEEYRDTGATDYAARPIPPTVR